MRFQKWDEHLLLINKETFDELPAGIVLHSIGGKKLITGKDEFSFDTRFGMLAYGFLHSPEEVTK